jgi:hypothetical protein
MALCCLISFHYLERLYPKDSYRTLTIITANNVVTSDMIESISKKDLKILYIELEKRLPNRTDHDEIAYPFLSPRTDRQAVSRHHFVAGTRGYRA